MCFQISWSGNTHPQAGESEKWGEAKVEEGRVAGWEEGGEGEVREGGRMRVRERKEEGGREERRNKDNWDRRLRTSTYLAIMYFRGI